MAKAKQQQKSQAVATRGSSAVASQKEFKSFLEKNLAQIGQVAVKQYIKPQQMIQIALVARSQVPMLAQCSPVSILAALMRSSQIGVYPCTPHQHAALIPRRNRHTGQYECDFELMYKGLIELGRRYDGVKRCWGQLVYEADEFEQVEGLERNLIHRPSLEGDRGEMTHVYAVIEFEDGAKDFEVLARREVDKIKASAQSKAGPWSDWYDRMAVKTAIKRLMNRQRLSDETAMALSLDDQYEVEGADKALTLGLPEDVPETAPVDRAASLAEKIKSKNEPAETETVEHVDPETGEVLTLSPEEAAEIEQMAARDID